MLQTCRQCGMRVNDVMSFSKDGKKRYVRCPGCYLATKPKIANEHDVESFLEMLGKKVKVRF